MGGQDEGSPAWSEVKARETKSCMEQRERRKYCSEGGNKEEALHGAGIKTGESKLCMEQREKRRERERGRERKRERDGCNDETLRGRGGIKRKPCTLTR